MVAISSQEPIVRRCSEGETLVGAISVPGRLRDCGMYCGEDAAPKGAATKSEASISAVPPIAPRNRLRLLAGADESRCPILVRSPGDAGAEFPGRAGEYDCVLPPRLERVSRSGRSE